MENGATVVEEEAVKDFSLRSTSLNIQDEECGEEAADEVKSNVKISFHLSLDQGAQTTESRTKKFLESDDAIISQIFSQTITSAGVTPTDEYDEFFEPNLGPPLPKPKKSSDAEEESLEEKSESEESQRLQILNMQQRPSIVIDCFDETPPLTPDEPTPGTGAFYFHQTIDDDDDLIEPNSGAESGVEDDIPSELLEAVQQYGLSDNFTTIEEDTDEILSPTTELTKTEEAERDNQQQEEENDEADSSAVHFLSNKETPHPEPALQSDNLVDDEDGWPRPVEVDAESDDSAENNITAKAFSFDDEACITYYY